MITDHVDHVVLEDPGQEEPDSPDVRRSQSMRSHRSRRYRRSPQRLYSPARSRAQGVWANQDLLEAPPGELAVSTTATTSVSTTTIGAGEKIPTFYSFSSTSVTGIIRCTDG